MTSEPVDQAVHFAERYRTTGAAVLIEAEMEVMGTDYQANGYTTRAQADHMGQLLQLGPHDRLLDIGAGCGWPGLYLARSSGCSVFNVDPVGGGLVIAAERGSRDHLVGQQFGLIARGDQLPVTAQSFDAVIHTDVTC